MRSFDVKSGENEEHSGDPAPSFWNLLLPKLEETNESFFGGNWYSMVDLHTLMLLLLLTEA